MKDDDRDPESTWDGVDRRRLQPREWHLDKKVQLSHILATLTVLVTFAGYMASIERDLALLKAEQAHSRERSKDQDKAIRQVIDSLDGRLARIELSLEKLTDRYNATDHKVPR